jgi:hypothetical protein
MTIISVAQKVPHTLEDLKHRAVQIKYTFQEMDNVKYNVRIIYRTLLLSFGGIGSI